VSRVFSGKKKLSPSSVLKMVIPLALFLIVVIAVIIGVNNVSQTSEAESLRTMEQAVRRSVVQCYALEGRYPPSLDYLQEHYGLSMDKDKYVYHYQALGSNLLPQIRVFSNSKRSRDGEKKAPRCGYNIRAFAVLRICNNGAVCRCAGCKRL
jgi:hypothetical protein